MKSNKSVVHHPRCAFTGSDGRRCRLFRSKGHDSLCLKHSRRELAAPPGEDPHSLALVARHLGSREEFLTATEVNVFLGKLAAIIARNQIPPRRAALLAYVGQLLLQTLGALKDEAVRAGGWDNWIRLLREAKEKVEKIPRLPRVTVARPSPSTRSDHTESHGENTNAEEDQRDAPLG